MSCFAISCPIELFDSLDDIRELLFGQMLVRRKGDHRVGLPIRHGKITLLVAIGTQAFLKVQRHRIMHFRLDPLFLAVGEELIPSFREHYVEVEHEFPVGEAPRQPDAGNPAEAFIQIGSVLDPRVGDEIDLVDEPIADHCLKRIEPRIAAHENDAIAILEAVVAQSPEMRRKVIVVGDDHAPVRPDIQVLERMKRETSRAAKSTGLLAGDIAEDALARILDHRQIVLLGNLHEGRHVGHLPRKMDRQERLGALGDLLLDLAHIHAEIVRAIDEDRTGIIFADRPYGRDEGVGRRYDLVFRSDADGLERQLERVCPRIHADCVTRADHCGELLLELADRLAEREIARGNELPEQVENFLDVLGAELLRQIGPLHLVSIRLQRQINARHSRTILHFWLAVIARRASARLSSVLRGGNRLTKTKRASMAASILARTLNSFSAPTPNRQSSLLPADWVTSANVPTNRSVPGISRCCMSWRSSTTKSIISAIRPAETRRQERGAAP